MKRKLNETPDRYAYRGYYLLKNPFTAEWYIRKDGAFIGTCSDEAAARRSVEELTGMGVWPDA